MAGSAPPMISNVCPKPAPPKAGRIVSCTDGGLSSHALSNERRSSSCGASAPAAACIYREAFNHAFEAHAGDPRREEAAHRIAWAAVKRSYVKVGDKWLPK
jgi:hypothetical protein